jgi:hypothetical protein
MMANSFGKYGHKYTKRKQYSAFLQFKNTAVHAVQAGQTDQAVLETVCAK